MKTLKILNKVSLILSYILTFISLITLIIGITALVDVLESISSNLAVKNGIGIILMCIYCIIGFMNSIIFFSYIFTKNLLNKRKINIINRSKVMLLCLIINFIPLITCIFSFLNLIYNYR